MTVVSELKKLVKTITGKDATGNTIDELVAELNANYPEGGGSVTVDNELKDDSSNPVENQVIKAALDAKADIFIVPFEVDRSTMTGSTEIETSAIADAFAAGKTVWGVMPNGVFPLVYCDSEAPVFVFSATIYDANLGAHESVVMFGLPTGANTFGWFVNQASISPLVLNGQISGSVATFSNPGVTLSDIEEFAESGGTVYLDVPPGDRYILCGYALDTQTDMYELQFQSISADYGVDAKTYIKTIGFTGHGDQSVSGSYSVAEITPV